MRDDIHTETDLLNAAAKALIRRDGDAFHSLLHLARNWMQTSAEAEAQERLLRAMQEAAYLLDGEPSELAEDDEDEAEDA